MHVFTLTLPDGSHLRYCHPLPEEDRNQMIRAIQKGLLKDPVEFTVEDGPNGLTRGTCKITHRIDDTEIRLELMILESWREWQPDEE